MKFQVPDMSCGHCTSAITAAIMAIDPDAKVETDLTDRTVSVTTGLPSETVAKAIGEAGYAATAG